MKKIIYGIIAIFLLSGCGLGKNIDKDINNSTISNDIVENKGVATSGYKGADSVETKNLEYKDEVFIGTTVKGTQEVLIGNTPR